MLSFFSSLGGAAALLLLLVPVGRVTVKYPDQLVMDLGCSRNDSNIIITINQMNHHCDNRVNPDIMARVQSCGYICHVDLHNQTHLDNILTAKAYSVEFFYDHYNNETSSHRVHYKRPFNDYNQVKLPQRLVEYFSFSKLFKYLFSFNIFYYHNIYNKITLFLFI